MAKFHTNVEQEKGGNDDILYPKGQNYCEITIYYYDYLLFNMITQELVWPDTKLVRLILAHLETVMIV